MADADGSAAAGTVRDFLRLLTPEGTALMAALPAYDPATVLGLTERLRAQGHSGDLVAAALGQARLRAAAREKFGAAADRMWFTGPGLQQATRPAVAARHVARYAGAAARRVLDLCCGIGGDLVPMAAAGLAVTGVDRDPLTAAVARANLRSAGLAGEVRVGDVSVLGPAELAGADGVFVDPARRSARGRTFDPRAYSPPFERVLELARAVPATGAKLAPGIPHAALPAGVEAEWVSHGGDVVECGLWFGPLAGAAPRRAILLPHGATVTGDGKRRAPVGRLGRFLHEPDGAVIRAGLVAEVAEPWGATLLDPTIAYLSTTAPVSSPFLTSYEVVDVMPFALKRLRGVLRGRGVGRLTVKKRGTAVDPEELRRRLRLSGDAEATVVLTRVAGEQMALLVEPLPTAR